jgi:hypothetical protein
VAQLARLCDVAPTASPCAEPSGHQLDHRIATPRRRAEPGKRYHFKLVLNALGTVLRRASCAFLDQRLLAADLAGAEVAVAGIIAA